MRVDIAAWLRGLGLEQYERAFRANDIDGEILLRLTAEDLAALGVGSVGHRRKLLETIGTLAGRARPRKRSRSTVEVRPGPAAAPGPRREAERRHLTVMFADLVGSTVLSARLDPEEMREVLAAYQDAVSAEVTRFGGHVAKLLGDGVLAFFGWPRAYEDAAERAVRAGLATAAAVGRLGTDERPALAARVGIATGLVVVGHLVGRNGAQEEAIAGETPNLAARLQEFAEPGAVVVAETTRRLVGDLFELQGLGSPALKGFAVPVAAWRVVGEGRAESRFEALRAAGMTPLVDRKKQLALLLTLWCRAREGKGQVVLLAGEAGIGKSRLVQALREQLAAEPHTRMSLQGSPYHAGSPLWPMIGFLERAAGFTQDDDAGTKLAKLEALLRQAVDDTSEATPLLAALLSIPPEEAYDPPDLPPQQLRERTFAALIEQLAGLAARRPVLAEFADAHWFDPSTLELVDRVIARVEHLPVLAVVTFRPDFTPPWRARPYLTALALSRLCRRDATTLVETLSGPEALPAGVLEQILARTDGIPLFLEELTKAVCETGPVPSEGTHGTLQRGPVPALVVPATLYDSLMARLDRSVPVKEVAQIGACIGREFSHELLAAAAGRPEPELRAALRQLLASGLIFRRGKPPGAVYAFKHALVQEAAYRSLLRSRRRELHRAIAAILEERFPDLGDATPELLAHHCTEAGQAARAADYWLKAGRRAAQASANAEAIGHFTRGLAVLSALPDTDARARRELELQLALGAAVRAAGWFTAAEAKPVYGRALELAEQLGDPSRLVHALRGLWGITYVAGEWRRAQDLVDRTDAAVRRTADPVALTVGHFIPGVTLFYQGELVAARAALDTALGFYDPDDHRAHVLASGMDNGVHVLNHLALALWMLGFPEASLQTAQRALDRARELAHPVSTGLALHFACHVHELRREWGSASRLADELMALGAKHDLAHFRAWGVTQRGAALVGRGEIAAGIADVRRGLAELRGAGDAAWRPFYGALLAGAVKEAGRTEEALCALDEAAALVDEGQRAYEAEVNRVAGELLLSVPGRRSEAEARLRRAVDVAHAQRARSWELRAATSLAHAWAEQGEGRKGLDLLAPLYGWFAEGLDTPDLRDAQGLLAALRSGQACFMNNSG
jgi:class 3 adenylate cyclase/predicted ATPase